MRAERGPSGDSTDTRAGARAEPTRADLCEMTKHLYDLALERTLDKDGCTQPWPDLSAANKSVELLAKLVGVLGDGKNLSLDQLRSELDRLGYRLEPKGKLKAVPK